VVLLVQNVAQNGVFVVPAWRNVPQSQGERATDSKGWRPSWVCSAKMRVLDAGFWVMEDGDG